MPQNTRVFVRRILGVFFAWLLFAPASLPAGEQKPVTTAELWKKLAGSDAAEAYRAIWALVQMPRQTIAFFRVHLQRAAAPDRRKVEQLIKDLQSPTFQVRERASSELRLLGELAEPFLQQARKGDLPLEGKTRIEKLLDDFARAALSLKQVRELRGLEVLELIGSPEACKLLEESTRGVPQARLTQKARESLARLARRPRNAPVATPAKPARHDLFGDPLPAGACARLGTVRLRHSYLADFSPDGKTLVSAHYAMLHVWDRATGKEIRRFGSPRGYPMAMAISPDGRLVAVNWGGGLEIGVWESASGKQVHHLKVERFSFRQPRSHVMLFSADGKTLSSGSDQSVHVWDMKTGKELSRFSITGTPENENDKKADTIILSSDGKLLVTASDSFRDGRFYLWNMGTTKPPRRLTGERDFLTAAFAPGGKVLATSHGGFAETSSVRFWDVATGTELRKFRGFQGVVVALAFSPDGKRLAMAVNENDSGHGVPALFLLDLTTAHEDRVRILPAPGVRWVRFAPDGKTLAWGCCQQTVCLADVATGKYQHDFAAHRGEIVSIAFSADGRRIATGSDDHSVCLWEVVTGKLIRKLASDQGPVHAVAFSPDGKWLGIQRQAVELRDAASGDREFTFRREHSKYLAFGFSPDSKLLALSTGDGVEIVDLSTRKDTDTIPMQDDPARLLAFSPDGKSLALKLSSAVEVREFPGGRLLHSFSSPRSLDSLAFSPDGRTLALSWEGKISLRELISGEERARFPGYLNRRSSVAFSPDGRLLGTGGNDPAWNMDKTVRVWDLATSKELRPFCGGHLFHVRSVAFSPDGRNLATASADGTALIWNLSAKGSPP